MSDDSVTILKYRTGKEPITQYRFFVMDKFDEEDEVLRLDKMIEYSKHLFAMYDDYKQIWIKTCPIFPTRG